MNKLIIPTIALCVVAFPNMAYAHYEVNPYSWMSKPNSVVDVQTENPLYSNEDDLRNDSDLVVKAVWTGARKTKEVNEQIVTISQIKIIAVIKGDSSLKSKKITIIEPAYQYEGVLNRYDGYSFMLRKKNYELFLTKSGGFWTIVGTVQGKKEL